MHRFFVLLPLLAGGISASTILSENFEGATVGFYTAGNNITGTSFSVVGGSVDLNGGLDYGWLCQSPAAGLCLDTTGSTGSFPFTRGVLETTNLLNLTPGLTVIQFSLVRWNDSQNGGGAQDASVTVSLGGLFSETFIVDQTWVNQTITRTVNVLSAQSAALRFTDNSGTAGYAGAILDNVTVQTGVPEPSTLALLGSALALLGWKIRKKS